MKNARLALTLILVVGGFAALEIGLVVIWWPIALIVGGSLALAYGLMIDFTEEPPSVEPVRRYIDEVRP